MSRIKDLEKRIADLSVEAKTLYGEMEADETKRTTENREKLDKILTDGNGLKNELKQAKEAEDFIKWSTEPEGTKAAHLQPQGGDDAATAQRGRQSKSWGRAFTDSPEFKAAFDQIKQGQHVAAVAPVQVKALYESVAANGGAAVFSDRRPEIVDRAFIAPTTVLDILNVSPTDSNLIEYTVLTGFTNNAAEVFEFTAGNFGLKPESDMTFTLENAAVQTIAHWIRTSRNLLADAPRLRNFIDTKLIEGLRSRLEAQILNGNGTAPNLRGILNTSGIQTRTMHATTPVGRGQTTSDTRLDTIRRAITDITLAFGTANAIVMNPSDAEDIELRKDTTNNYLNLYDPVAQRVWRTRVVESQRITALTALVGDFNLGATLYMREDAVIRISEHTQDDFIRNAIRILAELRAALVVEFPSMFERVTLI